MSYDQSDAPRADILIVDDTPANLHLLSKMLTEQGYRVRPVPDGSLAVAAVQAEAPDLILLDIRMPDMDGYQVCERLKGDAETCDIPIIFISALDATQDKVKAFTVGGVDYVTKPFQCEEVVARVETHLALRRLQTQLQDANKKLSEANRKMERELSLAGEVQASFLPHELPDIPGWQLAVTLKPTRETSGDFYDVNPLMDGRLGIVIADVVDKGAGAALFMALSWILIRTYAAEYPLNPELVLSAVNRRILEDTEAKQFVTVFYGVLDPVTGSLVYCNAGHCWPYIVKARGNGAVQPLRSTSMALGVAEDMISEQATTQLSPGDVLVLYTDGVTEAQNGQGMFFDEDRLLGCVQANLGRSAQDIQSGIMAKVCEFVGEAPQFDDIALMIVIRDPKERQLSV
jgi:sigma-B regulation protein RsbU (phosphoserine phosphatase)